MHYTLRRRGLSKPAWPPTVPPPGPLRRWLPDRHPFQILGEGPFRNLLTVRAQIVVVPRVLEVPDHLVHLANVTGSIPLAHADRDSVADGKFRRVGVRGDGAAELERRTASLRRLEPCRRSNRTSCAVRPLTPTLSREYR